MIAGSVEDDERLIQKHDIDRVFSVVSKQLTLEKALANAPADSVKLLLSHDPSHWREQVAGKQTDIALTFAGHTHGMQFGIDTKFYRWSPVKYVYKEWLDLYTENDQHLYVNRGFGYLGYPGRMGIYPEITVVTLA